MGYEWPGLRRATRGYLGLLGIPDDIDAYWRCAFTDAHGNSSPSRQNWIAYFTLDRGVMVFTRSFSHTLTRPLIQSSTHLCFVWKNIAKPDPTKTTNMWVPCVPVAEDLNRRRCSRLPFAWSLVYILLRMVWSPWFVVSPMFLAQDV